MNDDLGLVIKDNKVVVCSRDVARVFEREHKVVLKAIRELGCSDEFRRHNFMPSTYTNEQNHEQPEYLLTRDGFVLLAMGFKDYGMSARAFNKKLHELGVQYNTGSQWVLYQKYQDAGYAHSYTYEYTRPDGSHGTKMHLKWTQKGRLFLYNLLKDAGVLPVMEWE